MKSLLRQTLLILLSGLITVNNSFADNAYRIVRGEKAPFDGIELSDSYSKEVFDQLNDYDHLKLINESLEKSIDLYQENEKVYLKEIVELKDQNVNLDTSLQKANTNSFWKNAMWFALGVLVTGTAAYVSNKAR